MPTVTKAANAHTAVTGGWTNPSNAQATTGDNVYATAAPGKNATIDGDFGFPNFTTGDIPDGSTITDVTVTVEWGMTASVTGGTLGVQLRKSGVAQGTETTKTTTAEAQSTQSAGTGFSLSDLRSASTVMKARVRCSKGNTNSAMTGNLDFVSVTVTYTTDQSLTGAAIAAGTTLFAPVLAHAMTLGTIAATVLSAPSTAYAVSLPAISATALSPPALGAGGGPPATPTLLTSGTNASPPANSLVTAAVTFTAGRVYYFAVGVEVGGGHQPDMNQFRMSHGGVDRTGSWGVENWTPYGSLRAAAVYSYQATVTETCTLALALDGLDNSLVSTFHQLVEIASGFDTNDPSRQAKAATATGVGSVSVTLDSAPQTGNELLAFVWTRAASGALDPRTNWTELGEVLGTGTTEDSGALQCQYTLTLESTASGQPTVAGNRTWAIICIEVAAPAAAPAYADEFNHWGGRAAGVGAGGTNATVTGWTMPIVVPVSQTQDLDWFVGDIPIIQLAPPVAGAVQSLSLPNISGTALGAPTLAYAVTLPAIGPTATLAAPSAAYAITLGTRASAASVNPPTLAYAVTLPTRASAASVNSPSLAYAVTLPLIGPTAQVFAPTLAYAVTLGTRASAASVNPPTLAVGPVSLTLPAIGPTAQLFAPALAYAVTLPAIASGNQRFPPTLAHVVNLPTISGTVLSPPTQAYAISLPTISLTALFPPTLVPAQAVSLPTIPSGSALNPPTLAYAVTLPTLAGTALFAPTVANTQLLSLPTISAEQRFAPSLAYAVSLPAIGPTATLSPPSLLAVYSLTLPTISAEQRFAPSLAYAVSLPVISGTALFPPSLAAVGAVVLPAIGPTSVLGPPSAAYAVTLGTIGPSAVLGAPAVAYVVSLPFLGPTAQIYPPSQAPVYDLTLPAISGTVLYPPTLTGANAVALPSISGTVLYPPAAAATVVLPTIPSGSVLGPPTVRPDQPISLPAISGTQVYPPTVAAAGAISLPTIAAGTVLRAPTVTTLTAISLPRIGPTAVLYPPTVEVQAVDNMPAVLLVQSGPVAVLSVASGPGGLLLLASGPVAGLPSSAPTLTLVVTSGPPLTIEVAHVDGLLG